MFKTNTATTSRIINDNNRESVNNNNIIIIRDTEPGVSERKSAKEAATQLLNESREQVLQAYQDNLGTFLTGAVAEMLVHFVMDGHTIEQVLDAIERTGFAPRPSPAYLRAVLRNYDAHISKRPSPNKWYTDDYGQFRSENNLPF